MELYLIIGKFYFLFGKFKILFYIIISSNPHNYIFDFGILHLRKYQLEKERDRHENENSRYI